MEFGRFAVKTRQQRGQGTPETFAVLGFTHLCGKPGNGKFMVRRQPMRKRLQATLAEVKTELRRRLHDPVPELGKWLGAVVRGHIQYYGVPTNYSALFRLRSQVGWLWHRALSRRSQKGRVRWDPMRRLIDRWLPPLRIYHPYPQRPHTLTT